LKAQEKIKTRLKEIFIDLDLLPNNSQQRAMIAKGDGGGIAPLIHNLGDM